MCRHITRPALSYVRMQLNAACPIELKLEAPRRKGTTHVVMSPPEFLQRLVAPVQGLFLGAPQWRPEIGRFVKADPAQRMSRVGG